MTKKKIDDKDLIQPEEPEYGREEGEDNPEPDIDEAIEYVVLKGNCVRHNGQEYGEDMCIPVTGADAERLIKSGVIADLRTLRKKALAGANGVSITEG
ncbi:hypothetical protein ACQYRI_08885 [Salmonella enterica]